MSKCCFVIILLTALALSLFAQNAHNKPTILFVGMKHFELFKDIDTPKRQKEIREVVALLEKFKPTKIAFERQYGDEETSKLYSKYLRDEASLSIYESNQIGFRLAKQLRHQKVYGVDYRILGNLPSLDSSAKANKQEIFLRRLNEGLDAIGTPSDTMIKSSSVLEILRAVNAADFLPKTDEVILSSMVHIGQGVDYIGTDHVTEWYKRNLRIYTNITRVSDSSSDRVLVLMGAAHLNLLRRFASESGEYVLEDVNKYLN
jgi:hypothetical protein